MVLATTRQRVIWKARELWQQGFVTFDTETTGKESDDQIISWAVCDQFGKELGSGYVKPTIPISDGAYAIHGISEEQLQDAPSFKDAWPHLCELLAGKTVVIYNAVFDIGRLWASATAHDISFKYDFCNDICAMELFAQYYGEVHEYYGTYTWQKLSTAISHLGIEVPGVDHDALHDAMATALIIKKLAELADQELPEGWHPPVNVPCANCKKTTKERAEADEVWFCQSCSLELGLFHRCPGCDGIVEVPAIGFFCDDYCKYCMSSLHKEHMLLIGQWHRCPDTPYTIVETPDVDELCSFCQQRLAWNRKVEESNRQWREQQEAERKERRKATTQAYREKRKAFDEENKRRVTEGLPALEWPKAPAANRDPFKLHGHAFTWQKDQYGKWEVKCTICEGVWRDAPRAWCAGIKTYWSWQSVPEHLKTKTALKKEGLELAPGQQREAAIITMVNQYDLYDRSMAVEVKKKVVVSE
jgi:DNA polymerase III epsilon subunit-like protein